MDVFSTRVMGKIRQGFGFRKYLTDLRSFGSDDKMINVQLSKIRPIRKQSVSLKVQKYRTFVNFLTFENVQKLIYFGIVTRSCSSNRKRGYR